MSETASKLKEYALGLLSQRSYTCAGLRKKMEQWIAKKSPRGDFSMQDDIASLIDRFIELRILNDLDFCRMWVEERARMRPRGKFLLSQELRNKGISKEVLAQFWNDYGALDEITLATQVLEKKQPRVTGEPHKVRSTLYRHLASKGFGIGVIREILDKGPFPY